MIYLDNHASTQCDPIVIDAMLPYFGSSFGNPSSTIHDIGRDANNAVKIARVEVSALIGAKPKEIIFTSGATESNNIAIHGLVKGHNGSRRQIVTSPIEHKAIFNQCKALEKEGWEIKFLPVDKMGMVNLQKAEGIISSNTLVVSIQLASNEIGTIQPVKELAEIAHKNGAYFHTDAAQAVGKIPVNVNQLDVDLLSLSAHKMYGPKGVGALFVRGGAYAMPVKPIFYGGEQEDNLRSGTLNVPGIVGLGKACELCQMVLIEEMGRIAALRDLLEEQLLEKVDVQRNGALNNRLPGNSSLTFPEVEADALIINTPELAISTGSACSSGALEPSYVLQAIGLSRNVADCTIRIGVGRFNNESEINFAAKRITEAVKRILYIK